MHNSFPLELSHIDSYVYAGHWCPPDPHAQTVTEQDSVAPLFKGDAVHLRGTDEFVNFIAATSAMLGYPARTYMPGASATPVAALNALLAHQQPIMSWNGLHAEGIIVPAETAQTVFKMFSPGQERAARAPGEGGMPLYALGDVERIALTESEETNPFNHDVVVLTVTAVRTGGRTKFLLPGVVAPGLGFLKRTKMNGGKVVAIVNTSENPHYGFGFTEIEPHDFDVYTFSDSPYPVHPPSRHSQENLAIGRHAFEVLRELIVEKNIPFYLGLGIGPNQECLANELLKSKVKARGYFAEMIFPEVIRLYQAGLIDTEEVAMIASFYSGNVHDTVVELTNAGKLLFAPSRITNRPAYYRQLGDKLHAIGVTMVSTAMIDLSGNQICYKAINSQGEEVWLNGIGGNPDLQTGAAATGLDLTGRNVARGIALVALKPYHLDKAGNIKEINIHRDISTTPDGKNAVLTGARNYVLVTPHGWMEVDTARISSEEKFARDLVASVVDRPYQDAILWHLGYDRVFSGVDASVAA
ncbi:MAG: hypothetical protein ACOCXT_03830 [Candidatus Dojkabacteria bacterium]